MPEARERGNDESVFNGDRISVWEGEVLDMDGGDLQQCKCT